MRKILCSIALVTVSLVVAPASASAAGVQPDACAVHTATGYDWYPSSGPSDPFGNTNVWYTELLRKPNSSSCRDINVSNVQWEFGDPGTHMPMAVRFYPSSGGSYLGSVKRVPADSGTTMVLATNVLPNTQFRIEGSSAVPYTVKVTD